MTLSADVRSVTSTIRLVAGGDSLSLQMWNCSAGLKAAVQLQSAWVTASCSVWTLGKQALLHFSSCKFTMPLHVEVKCYISYRDICSQALVQSIRMWTLMIYYTGIRCKRGSAGVLSHWGCDEISTNWQSTDYWHCTLNTYPHCKWCIFFFFQTTPQLSFTFFHSLWKAIKLITPATKGLFSQCILSPLSYERSAESQRSLLSGCPQGAASLTLISGCKSQNTFSGT